MHAGRLLYLHRPVERDKCGAASQTGALRQTGSPGMMALLQLSQCQKVSSQMHLPWTNSRSRTYSTPTVSAIATASCRALLGCVLQLCSVQSRGPPLHEVQIMSTGDHGHTVCKEQSIRRARCKHDQQLVVRLRLSFELKEHAESGFGAQVTGIVLSVGPATSLAVASASNVDGQG